MFPRVPLSDSAISVPALRVCGLGQVATGDRGHQNPPTGSHAIHPSVIMGIRASHARPEANTLLQLRYISGQAII